MSASARSITVDVENAKLTELRGDENYTLAVKSDGKPTTLVAEGTFPDIGNMPVQQRVEFARPVRARYYKIVALEPWESSSIFASIGRLEIF